MRESIAAAAAAAAVVAGLAIAADRAWTSRRRTTTASINHEEEEEEIDSVLHFWFHDAGNRKRWFLEEGPARDEFDAEVTRRFGSLLERCLSSPSSTLSWPTHTQRGALAMIILLDQFSRHIHRQNRRVIDAQCGPLAIKVLEQCLSDEFQHHLECNGEELAFLLMPYRHEAPVVRPDKLRLVLQLVDQHELRHIRYKQHLDRFKRVSESRASELRQHADTAAAAAIVYSDEDLLERVCVEDKDADRLQSQQHAQLVVVALQKYAQDLPSRTLLVSLSGGVDSMVITDCLLHVKRADQRVVCAHVDYGNRPESHAEAAFLERFCGRNGIPLYVTDVASSAGLLRGVTDREEYEEQSRQVRFALYKRAWAAEEEEEQQPRVVFGHHQGDVVENVLSNAMKGKTLVELSGMTHTALINDCFVNRPLLPLPKSMILAYADEFSVPYFKDTTPRWSTRGQVRNELLPSIERVYGGGFPLHLARLAEQSDETYALLVGDTPTLLGQVMVAGGGGGTGDLVAFAVDLDKLAGKPLFVWRIALRKACHHSGVLAATDKAVQFLFDTLAKKKKRKKESGGWFVEMRRGIRAYVWDARYLVLFKIDPDHILGKQSADADVEEFAVDGPARQVGRWRVRVVSSTGEEEEEDAAVVTMASVWDALVAAKPAAASAMGAVLKYRIPAGEGGVYRLLPRSQRQLKSVDVDLALRQALLPIVAAKGKEHRDGKGGVVVVCEWS